MTVEVDEFALKYEIEEIEKMILNVLEKHPRGMHDFDIIAELPKDLNEKVIKLVLALLVNNGTLVPVADCGVILPNHNEYRINKRKYKESPFAGFLDDELNKIIDEKIENGEKFE